SFWSAAVRHRFGSWIQGWLAVAQNPKGVEPPHSKCWRLGRPAATVQDMKRIGRRWAVLIVLLAGVRVCRCGRGGGGAAAAAPAAMPALSGDGAASSRAN